MIRNRKSNLAALAAVSALALGACSGMSADGGSGSEDGSFTLEGEARMIVPFAAGGGSDLAGRAIAGGLEDVIGNNVTVENIVGGSGAVGYAELLSAAGDPTQLLASETSLISLPIVQDVPFTYEDFTPIMKVGEAFNIVIASADSPFQTCTDVIEAAKSGKVTAAVSGTTSPDAIAWGLIEQNSGISLERVTFESSAEVVAGLLGGDVDVAMSSPGEVLGQLEAGDIKGLCALAPERYSHDVLADIPIGQEQGIDVTFAQWRGFIAPGGISEEARQFWIEAGKEFAESDAYQEYIDKTMLQPEVAYGDDFVSYLEEYEANVKKVLNDG